MGEAGRTVRIAAGLALAFGGLTLISGVTALRGTIDMGAVVPFVLWFNTLAGLAYVVAGLGLWRGRRWAFPLSIAIFAATVVVVLGFGLHIARGGAFEMRTVFALALRSAFWGVIVLVARQIPAAR